MVSCSSMWFKGTILFLSITEVWKQDRTDCGNFRHLVNWIRLAEFGFSANCVFNPHQMLTSLWLELACCSYGTNHPIKSQKGLPVSALKNRSGMRGDKLIIPCCQQSIPVNRLGDTWEEGKFGLNWKERRLSRKYGKVSTEKMMKGLVEIGWQQWEKYVLPAGVPHSSDNSSTLWWWIANVISHSEFHIFMSSW